jgi:ketosteroid isomerase-like protein
LRSPHSVNHVMGALKDGQRLDMYWRATMCFRKIDGEWTVVDTPTSVPFDMQTGEASLDLEP